MARKGNKKSNSKSRTVSAGETTEEHSSSNCEAVEVASRSTYSYDSEDETPKDEEFYEKNEQEQEELEESESESGAYEIIPMLCSLMRKGTIVMIRNRPCKIVEMSTSKTGKHGHAKW